MKRSELTKELFRYFDQHLNLDMEPEWIEDILNICEDVGMLPPFVDKSVIGPDKDYFDLHVGQSVYSGVCEWESEDET